MLVVVSNRLITTEREGYFTSPVRRRAEADI